MHSKPALQMGFTDFLFLLVQTKKENLFSLYQAALLWRDETLGMPTMFSTQVAHAIFKRGEKMISIKKEVG